MLERYAAFVSYAHRYKDWVAALQRNLETCLRTAGAEPSEIFLDQVCLLLLLDGLDEVPRDDRDDAEALLRQLSKRWPKAPLVVTSRPIGYRRPSSEFVELELLPFDERQRRQFLEQWFRRGTGFGHTSGATAVREAEKVMKALADESGLRDLAGNPLYLTLMALLFERGQSPNRNRSRLYDQVFQLLLDGRHRPEQKGIACQAGVRALLRRLASDMTRDDHDAEPKAEIEARLPPTRDFQAVSPPPDPPRGTVRLLAQVES